MTGMPAILLSILMLAAFLLGLGAYATHRRGDARKALLMLVCALVLIGNVLIWTL
jgi:hypothetical protein